MVSIDITTGSEILEILDKSKIKVVVALWANFSEYGDWRLYIAEKALEASGKSDGYGLLRSALDAANFPFQQRPPIQILSMKDSFIRDLRRIFGKTKSVDGMRLGGQLLGDRFLEEGYVYRIT